MSAIQAKFADPATLEISGTALRSAISLGYDLDGIIAVVRLLSPRDFMKSETAHSPSNSRVWHDTYRTRDDTFDLYLKFAGETLVDVVLVSFKEA